MGSQTFWMWSVDSDRCHDFHVNTGSFWLASISSCIFADTVIRIHGAVLVKSHNLYVHIWTIFVLKSFFFILPSLFLFCKNSLDCRAASQGSCLLFQMVPFSLSLNGFHWRSPFCVCVCVCVCAVRLLLWLQVSRISAAHWRKCIRSLDRAVVRQGCRGWTLRPHVLSFPPAFCKQVYLVQDGCWKPWSTADGAFNGSFTLNKEIELTMTPLADSHSFRLNFKGEGFSRSSYAKLLTNLIEGLVSITLTNLIEGLASQ